MGVLVGAARMERDWRMDKNQRRNAVLVAVVVVGKFSCFTCRSRIVICKRESKRVCVTTRQGCVTFINS